MGREGKIAVAVFWITLIILCTLVGRNTSAVNASTDLDARQEYERVVLGCNSSGALTSTNPDLRKLCDVTLPQLAKQQKGK